MNSDETKDRGRIILFTGDGKGKTTAALGMVLRASGHGMKALIIQFVKADPSTGELAACRHLPGVEIVQTGRGFIPERTSPEFQEHCSAARRLYRGVMISSCWMRYATPSGKASWMRNRSLRSSVKAEPEPAS
jgi:ATP:corrinoid adenosyltransferase